MSKAIVVQGLRSPAAIRLGIGIAQGIALCLLWGASATGSWPAHNGMIFAPLLMVACFIPLIVLFGLGNMRHRSSVVWAIVAAMLLAALAVHDASRAIDADHRFLLRLFAGAQDFRIWPSRTLVIFTVVGLFIAQSLVVASDGDRAAIAAYPLYFDAAWTLAVEVVLAVSFVGLLWMVLLLGAGLFKLMGVAFFSGLLREPWFALPLTTLAFACAVHVADARTGILRSIRGRLLALLSWLLPLVTLFVAAWLATLPFTGLTPLWRTHPAGELLLAMILVMLALINATYQDGLPEREPPRVLRQAARIAALMLMPLVVIAGYGLALRVAQHGWTTDRIIALACIVAAACYALGYAVAAIASGPLRHIELSNVAAAFVVLGLLVALSTPIADPARLAVSAQLARLDAGVVPPEEFDFAYLRFESGRYGAAALARLRAREEGPDAVTVRRRAREALAMTSREGPQLISPTSAELAAHIKVFPRGQKLPASFLQQDWSKFKKWELPRCLVDSSVECDAFLVDLNRNGRDEVVMDDHTQMIVMTADAQGKWSRVGHLVGPDRCGKVKEALRAGKFEAEAPAWSDIKVGDMRLAVANGFGDCP